MNHNSKLELMSDNQLVDAGYLVIEKTEFMTKFSPTEKYRRAMANIFDKSPPLLCMKTMTLEPVMYRPVVILHAVEEEETTKQFKMSEVDSLLYDYMGNSTDISALEETVLKVVDASWE